ncbi:MAG TPA: FAD-dependent oxidoreductase [Candidatus Saccharimonadales bacterium]|nr:FAD-dependent oxidoreductase [Candidatus Saccharimonadales bacterium]
MKLTLNHIRAEGGNAATFVFHLAEPLEWQAGHSFHLEVPGDYAPIEHTFTISSAPAEGVIAITTRPSDSPYKRSLFGLQSGENVEGNAFGGTFTWRETTLQPVFLASGIGITPFRAMLKQRVLTGERLPITLIYASATGDSIFKSELDQWATAYPEFSLHYIVGERLNFGHVLAATEPNKSLFYVSGPSLMVDDISAALQAHGVLDSQLVRDWFTGRLPD